MINFIKGITKKISEVEVSLSISADGLLQILKRFITEKDINIQSVEIKEGCLTIYGTVKKWKVNINFSYTLVKEQITDRTIHFKVKNAKPIHSNWINNKVFNNKLPYVSYNDKRLSLDLNEVESVRKSPIGKVRDLEFSDNSLVLKISV